VRLFVAVEIGPEVQATVSRVIGELKRRTEQSAPHARVTWVKAAHLHLTVRFIGEVDGNLNEKILTALSEPLCVPAFELTLAGTGTFPPKRPPRVIWAGIKVGINELHALEQEVRSRLDRLLAPDGQRSYQPHVTLARVKNPAGLRPAVLLDGLETAVFGGVRIGAVTLFESRLSSSGPIYAVLGRTALAHAS
jgi:RNA 2',3'-cyclic 3'-phosphodiesterase